MAERMARYRGLRILTIPDPFEALVWAILGQQINVGQSITREEAMRWFTRDNAWHMSMEDDLGTIEVGKLADLVVLSADYLKVPDEDLKRLKPILTLVSGQRVYDAGVV